MASSSEDHPETFDATRISADATAKPPQLVAIGPVVETLFHTLRDWFHVPADVALDLTSISSDAVTEQLLDRQMVVAMAMRKLQALHLIAQPGYRTVADVVVNQIDGMLRTLVAAPEAHLIRQAEHCDWDHEFAIFDAGMLYQDPTRADEERQRFRLLVETLVAARDAVMRCCPDGPRVLE